ncbi:MAG TPA: lysophospholipid acyltransferase family protein [Polyangium sp.]|nr:lysophospholipid acyltransferase family protein [Polyangium sp.]
MREVDPELIEQVLGGIHATLGRYHSFSLVGGEHIPREGSLLGITTHGMATYDLFLTAYAIYKASGRPVRALGDAIWFRTERSASIFERLGMVNTQPEVARQLLDEGHVVAVAPGGLREAIRPSTQRFRVDWKGRSGFARLALEAQKPILLAACPAADLIYTLYDNPLTTFAYRKWKVPLPIMRGLGPSLIPRPVRLTTYCSPTFLPPKIARERATEDEVQAYRVELTDKMNNFIREICAKEGLFPESPSR